MRKLEKRRWLISISCAAGLVIASCGGGSDEGGTASDAVPGASAATTDDEVTLPEKGGTLTVASHTPVAYWDLAASAAGETSAIAYPLVFGYYMRDIDGELVPDLLESATPSSDFMTWTLALRPGMSWSDGSPVTSADLKFSLEFTANDPQYGYLIGSPSSDDINVVDELAVEIKLASPNTEIVTLGMSAPNSNLYPVDFGGRTEEEFFLAPIGAGPFVIESNSDAEVTLVKNEFYWDAGNINLDRIELVIVPDNNAKLVGFEAGDYDIITRQPTSVVGQLDSSSTGAALIVDPSANVEALFLNGALPPFDDVNFRRAVQLGIDRDTIARGVFDEFATVATGMIPSAVPAATPGDEPMSYDPTRAAEFLAQSRYATDASFDLALIDGDGARRDEAQIIADQLSAIGITVTVRPMGFAEFSELIFTNQQHHAVLYGYETVATPASDIIGFFAGTGGFFGGYDTTTAIAQFAALQAATDEAGKSAVINQFETEFAQMAYAVPIVEPLWILGVADRVKGLRVPPTGFPDLAYVSVG